MINFGEIFTRAWQIVWKHKVLWIFGIFAGCASGNGGSGGGNNSTNFSDNNFGSNGGDLPPFLQNFAYQFEDLVKGITQEQIITFVIALFCVLFIFSILSYALGVMGKIGLLRGTIQAESGAEKLTFASIWAESRPFFGRVFGLAFGLDFLILVLMLIFIVPLIIFAETTDQSGILFLLLPIFCLLIPLAIGVSVVIGVSSLSIVIDDLPILAGIKRGFDVLKNNFASMLVMAILLFVINAVVGLITALPFIIILAPIFLSILAGGEMMQAGLITTLVCFVFFLPISILINGILESFNHSAWGLTYLRVTAPVNPLEVEHGKFEA